MSRSSSTPAPSVSGRPEDGDRTGAFVVAGRSLDRATGEAAFTYRLGDDEFTERLTLDPSLLTGTAPERCRAETTPVTLTPRASSSAFNRQAA